MLGIYFSPKPQAKPELKDLVSAANEVAKTARDVLTAMLVVALTLAATMIAATDEALLRDSAEVFPGLGAKVKLSTVFLLAPIVFAFLHANALLQLHLLAGRVRALDEEMKAQGLNEAARKPWRRMIHGFAFAQLLAGDDSHGGGWGEKLHRALLAFISWLTIVVVPVALLVCAQVSFVRYQSEAITLTQQITISLDLLLLIWFHLVTWRQVAKPVYLAVIWSAIGSTSVAAILWLVWLQAVLPSPQNDPDSVRWAFTQEGARPGTGMAPAYGEEAHSFSKWFYRSLRPGLPQVSGCPAFSSSAQGCTLVGPANLLDRWAVVAGWDWSRRYLDLSNRTLIESDVKHDLVKVFFSDNESLHTLRKLVAIDLRNRTLRFSNFNGARLFSADLRNIRADKSTWRDSDIQGANMFMARLKGADLTMARLNGVFLSWAHLEGANLYGTDLQGATLTIENKAGEVPVTPIEQYGPAYLVGANFSGAKLIEANLSGATLQNVNLTASTLDQAKLGGSYIHRANFHLATDIHHSCNLSLLAEPDNRNAASRNQVINQFDTFLNSKAMNEIRRRLENESPPTCIGDPLTKLSPPPTDAFAKARIKAACSHFAAASRIREAKLPSSYDDAFNKAWDTETCPAVMAVKRERGEVR